MSTRCNIIVKDDENKVYLYHHHDGYPSGVGVDLLKKFYKRFKDGNYIYMEDVVNELIKDKNDDEYEYTTGLHGDIEYVYEIDTSARTIKGYEYNYNDEAYGDEIAMDEYLNRWTVTRSDKDGRNNWYLSQANGTIYTDDDGNTIYFTSYEDACDEIDNLNND